MPSRLKLLWQKAGRIEKTFLAVLILDLVLSFAAPASAFRLAASIVAWILGVVVVFRFVQRHAAQLIWRLRNRLIVAYVFIAVVPVLLIVALVASGTYVVTGQLAVYLINSELERRNSILAGPAGMLAGEAPSERQEYTRRLLPYLQNRFRGLQFTIADRAEGSPQKDVSGFLVKDESLYSWAHAIRNRTEVTLVAPLTHELLTSLIPGLGDVFVLSGEGETVRLDSTGATERDATPPAYNSFDIPVTGASVVPVASADPAAGRHSALLVVHTRASAVLGIIFGQKFDVGQAAVLLFLGVAILLLLFELGSLVAGISLSRTITGAVDNLYEGTERVSHGDFSHRIAVQGGDQLAELGASFNQMTANLERLIVVEKEKERLQSELEIAREVQNQLFPKESPVLETAQIHGVCHPARMVSGDYYDFLALPDSTLALAIGDVAGKGISAALLMAAIQSTMRTQLSAGAAMAASAGNGRHHNDLSTARLVSQLNKQLYANTSAEKYATFYFGLYDQSRSILKYTNAGHLPPILLRDGRPHADLDVTGTVVGAFPFSPYEEKEIELRAGDMLVGYTDGVVEPENPYGEQFGEDRLKDLLVKYIEQPAEEIIARVMEAVEQWTASSELQDDMTMLVVRRI
jgi:sigma-B regulation protein RsbU (phosphoserine phosphatase)